jgi:UDP-N-acetylglucosamine 2-epimerase
VEVAAESTSTITNEQLNAYGVGHAVDLAKPFLLVIQHPVTTERDNRAHLEQTLEAVSRLGLQTIWIWPNPDAGTGEMAERLRHFRERAGHEAERMRFITDVPVGEFVALLKLAACLVGNSSAGIKECSYLGTPVVNVGCRQQGRLYASNVVHVDYDADAIAAAIRSQIAHGTYVPSYIYFRQGCSDAIVDALTTAELYTQKRFWESSGVVPR